MVNQFCLMTQHLPVVPSDPGSPASMNPEVSVTTDHASVPATRAEPLMMVDPISGYIMACLTLRTLTMVPASMTLLMLLSPVSSYLHMSVMLRTQQCLPPCT